MTACLPATYFETAERNTDVLVSMKIIQMRRKVRWGRNLVHSDKDCDGSRDKGNRNSDSRRDSAYVGLCGAGSVSVDTNQ